MAEGDENDPALEIPAAARAERIRRQLITALERYRHNAAPSQRSEPEHLVYLLFRFLLEMRDQLSPGVCYDEEAVRHWFAEQGRWKTPSERIEIANLGLLLSYDLEKERLGDAFKVMQFVHDRVEANKKLPRSEQRGAGGIDPVAFHKHLHTVLKERETERRQTAELARLKELRFLREGIDYGRRRLAEVSAAFARASSKINKASDPTPT